MAIEIIERENITVVKRISLTCDKCGRSYELENRHFKEEDNGQEFFCESCKYEIKNEKAKKFYGEKLIGATITDFEIQEFKLVGLELKYENGDEEWIDLETLSETIERE